MKSIAAKTAAIILAAAALVVAAAGFLGAVVCLEQGFYEEKDLKTWEQERVEDMTYNLAVNLAEWYAQMELSDCPVDAMQLRYGYGYGEEPQVFAQWLGIEEDQWHYRIVDTQNNVRITSEGYAAFPAGESITHTVSVDYLVLGDRDNYHIEEYSEETGETYYLEWATLQDCEVTILLTEIAIAEYWGMPVGLAQQLFAVRYSAIWIAAAGLLIFIVCLVYLCWAAGKRTGTDLTAPGGLNRLPLDLYLAGAFFGCFGLIWVTWVSLDMAFRVTPGQSHWLIPAVVAAFFAAALAICFLFAFAAQVKGKSCFWWRNSITGRFCKLLWRGIRFISEAVVKFISLLPMIWQWLLVLGAELFWLMIAIFTRSGFFAFVMICLGIATVFYTAYACGVLFKGMHQMAQGNLQVKISKKFLIGSFAQSADDLNALADVATTAAKKQMRSERMKTELITNVSHDIKTPLTSIINYVDFLGMAQTDEQRQQYLEVLARQSQQMKRLLEDLMEMSRASSGNLSVEKKDLDAAETVNQALGEYADKLEKAGLTPVFRQPEKLTYIHADGRLTWRVLSNLLSNVVKYALSGTRVYLELTQEENWVVLSIKNISREELNMSAQELMERFVRGDVSRNTEGSGLGLNIAQSLMDAQGGHLELHLDGDLFKVTLRFPVKE